MSITTSRPTTPAAHPDWRQDALCARVDADLFFPVPHTPGWQKQTQDAKKVCGRCPVREACLEWALATRQPAGVWGGLSEAERRELGGVRESHTQLCMRMQPWIEQQLADGCSQRNVADRLGVTRATLSRCITRWENERAVQRAGEVQAA